MSDDNGSTRKDKNKTNSKFEKAIKKEFTKKPYHKEGNYRFIYANIDCYAVAEGGKKGGHLIRALNSVFANVNAIIASDLDPIVYQLNKQAKKRVGTSVVVQQIEDVSRMDGPATLRIRIRCARCRVFVEYFTNSTMNVM